jgi:dolichol-phosphate mannosyltransferase
MKTLICVPTYNEAENIEPLIRRIHEQVDSEVSVLVIDDGSPDGTGAKAEALAKQGFRVSVLHRPKKMGLGTAYVAGFEWGMAQGFERLIEMDADFSHDPKYLPTQLKLLDRYDVTIGSRYVPGGGTVNWGLGRKLISRGGSWYARSILGAPVRDFTGGFNGWRRSVLEAVDLKSLRSDGYSFQIELKYRAFLKGFRLVEFPIVFEDRKVGKSKMSKKIVLEALKRVWSFRFSSGRFRGERQIPPACAPLDAMLK